MSFGDKLRSRIEHQWYSIDLGYRLFGGMHLTYLCEKNERILRLAKILLFKPPVGMFELVEVSQETTVPEEALSERLGSSDLVAAHFTSVWC